MKKREARQLVDRYLVTHASMPGLFVNTEAPEVSLQSVSIYRVPTGISRFFGMQNIYRDEKVVETTTVKKLAGEVITEVTRYMQERGRNASNLKLREIASTAMEQYLLDWDWEQVIDPCSESNTAE